MDTVILNGVRADLVVGLDAWHRPNKPQPVLLNIEMVPMETLEAAANEDDVNLTINYGTIYKTLTQKVTNRSYSNVQELFLAVQECLPQLKTSSIEIVLPKVILLAEEGVSFLRKHLSSEDVGPAVYQRLEIRKIQCKCIIGVNPHERLVKQRLVCTISAESLSTPLGTAVLAGTNLEESSHPSYIEAIREVVDRVENSSYLTIEALATAIAQIVTMNYGFDNATVRIEKPSAMLLINAAGVQVTRTKAYFENKDFWKVKRP